MTIALNFSVLIRVGNNSILIINLLRYFAAIDDHDKIEPLLVIPGVVPKFDVADVWTNKIERCVKKLIKHEIVFCIWAVLLLGLDSLSVEVPAINGLMPIDGDFSLLDFLQIWKELNPEILVWFLARSQQCASDCLILSSHVEIFCICIIVQILFSFARIECWVHNMVIQVETKDAAHCCNEHYCAHPTK